VRLRFCKLAANLQQCSQNFASDCGKQKEQTWPTGVRCTYRLDDNAGADVHEHTASHYPYRSSKLQMIAELSGVKTEWAGGTIYCGRRDAVRQDTTRSYKRTSSCRRATGQWSGIESDRMVGGGGHVAIRWFDESFERCMTSVRRDRASQQHHDEGEGDASVWMHWRSANFLSAKVVTCLSALLDLAQQSGVCMSIRYNYILIVSLYPIDIHTALLRPIMTRQQALPRPQFLPLPDSARPSCPAPSTPSRPAPAPLRQRARPHSRTAP
jgi:hypothetical protein